MVASKTLGGWIYWLFLYCVACIPAALFGVITASSYIYNYDHFHHYANYFRTLYTWEWIAAVICAAPGFVWVSVSQLRDHRKEQAKVRKRETAEIDDASV